MSVSTTRSQATEIVSCFILISQHFISIIRRMGQANIMPTNFKPVYTINPAIAKYLMRIEAAKEKVALLPVNPTVLASLRETAKLYTTHYSTMIEGNQLMLSQASKLVVCLALNLEQMPLFVKNGSTVAFWR